MVVCKYYQQGRCKFGNQCKYEHIDPPQRGSSSDPFNKSSNHSNHSNHSGRNNSHSSGPRHDTRIFWPLSAVGIEDNPEQGNMLDADLSPEEMRVMAYREAPRGSGPSVAQKEAALVNEHKQKMQALGLPVQSAPSQAQSAVPNDPFANATPQAFPPQQTNGADPFSPMHSNSSQSYSSQQANPFAAAPPSFAAAPPSFAAQPPQQPQQAIVGFSPAPQMNMQPALAQEQQQVPMHQPAQQMSMQNAAPQQATPPAQNQPPNQQAEQQFNATAFGFSKVPESAPPPQFY